VRIYVGGSLQDVPRYPSLCRDFVAALGTAIASRGHVLLTGCRSSVDQEIASAAERWLDGNPGNPKAGHRKEKIISYCLKSDQPIHSFGTVRYSALLDWGMAHPELVVPEQIALADATMFVAGGEGTFWARNWALFARRPILGIPRFGGSGETIYDQELKRLRETSLVVAGDYETLNSLSEDMATYATEVVSLAERLITPRTVFTVMSFERAFEDVFKSYKEVCLENDFDADRIDKTPSVARILPRIETGIRKSAFVIADISELKPNVFYEVGYAKALGKDVILTAKKGTQLPFDVGDVPVIFWENQDDLKDGLRKCIDGIKEGFGR
jgi:hypothetical protein